MFAPRPKHSNSMMTMWLFWEKPVGFCMQTLLMWAITMPDDFLHDVHVYIKYVMLNTVYIIVILDLLQEKLHFFLKRTQVAKRNNQTAAVNPLLPHWVVMVQNVSGGYLLDLSATLTISHKQQYVTETKMEKYWKLNY